MRSRLDSLARCVALAAAFAGAAQFTLAQSDPAELEVARAAVARDEAARVEAFAAAARTVVCIFANNERKGGGSGVIVSPDGYGVTNFHVVQEFVEVGVGVGGLADGKLYPLRVLGIDPGGDVAMFKLEGRERFDCATIGESSQVRVGQWVAAMGNPFLLAEDYSPTVTLGVVSGVHRYQEGQNNLLEYADCIQVATSINPGNSGGPLFDLRGRVVGINGRISAEERGRVNVGLGYSITFDQIRRFMPGLRAGRLMEHGTLGATVQQIGGEIIVSAIQDLSPAERAGLRLGDTVVSIMGKSLHTPNEFNNAVVQLPADWPVEIVYRRDGRELRGSCRTERLALKGAPAVVPKFELNLAQVRECWRRHDRLLGRVLQPVHGQRWVIEASIVDARRAADDGAPMRVIVEDADTVSIDWSGVPVDVARVWQGPSSEFGRLIGAAVGLRRLGLGWELSGGDDVGGRVCAVVQLKAASGPRLRWKFSDDGDGVLLAAATMNDEGGEAAVWRVAELRDLDGTRVATRWTRTAADGEVLQFDARRIVSEPARAAASQAAEERR